MFLVRILRRLFIDQWKVIDGEVVGGRTQQEPSAKARKARSKKKAKKKGAKPKAEVPAAPYDWRPIVFLVLVAVTLTLQVYWGNARFFKKLFPIRDAGMSVGDYQMWSFAWSTGWRFLGCVLIPLVALLLMPGERLRDYGAAFRSYLARRWWVIALMVVVVPELFFGGVRESFGAAYPRYSWAETGPKYLVVWLALHAIQLLCLEFFFRVVTLTGLRRRLGSTAVFVMTVPYCMLLFGGSIPEALWVIVTSVVLGTLAMRKGPLAREGGGVRAFLLGQWQQIEEEVAREKGEDGQGADAPFDWRPVVFLLVVALSLTVQEFWGDRGNRGFMGIWSRAELGLPERDYQLLSFCWWSGWRFIGYVVIPVLAICLMPGQRIRDYFVSFRDFFKHLWIYIGLFMLVLPAVLFAATQKSFLATYPFYKWSNMGFKYFILWQLLYALQFVSLEFFFRGFMLAGLRDKCGSASIFIMCVPYCMIHYGKPMPETLGAIIAGLVLGTLAMRTRSIWGGALIHIAVAVTMDLLAIRHCPDASTGRPCPYIPH